MRDTTKETFYCIFLIAAAVLASLLKKFRNQQETLGFSAYKETHSLR